MSEFFFSNRFDTSFLPSTIQYWDRCVAPCAKEALSLDIYHSSNTQKPRNIMLYVHGGGLTKGDKRTGRVLCQYLADARTALVCINYPLEISGSMVLVDVQLEALIRAFRACVGLSLFSDIKNTVVIGHSAGSFLLSLLFLTRPSLWPSPSLALFDCAAYNLLEKYKSGNNKVKSHIGSVFGLPSTSRVSDLMQYSPVHLASEVHAFDNVSWHLIAGKGLRSRRAAIQLATALGMNGQYARTYQTEFDHNDPMMFFATDTDKNVIIDRLLGST